MKYALPRVAGPALSRLVGQVEAALASGKGEAVVVWAMRAPTPQELRVVAQALGTNASRIQIISGVQALGEWVGRFFGV